MTRIITLIGGKGGAGKTTSAINLAAALTYFGKKAIVVDANLTTPNVSLHLGSPIVPVTLHDVLKGRNHITESVYLHPSGIRVVPSSISLNAIKNVDPEKLEYIMQDLHGLSDFVIIDAAAGLGREALAALKSGEEILIITNPEISAVTDALKTIKLAEELGKKVLGVLVNKTNPKNMDMPPDDIEAMLENKIIGIIPEDRAVKFATARKDTVVSMYPNAAASVAYKRLAAHLANENYEEPLYQETADKTVLEAMADWVVKFLGLKD